MLVCMWKISFGILIVVWFYSGRLFKKRIGANCGLGKWQYFCNCVIFHNSTIFLDIFLYKPDSFSVIFMGEKEHSRKIG